MNEEQLKLLKKLCISEWPTPYFAFLASIILEGLLSLCCRLDDLMNSQQSWTLRTYPEVLLLKSVSFFAVTCVLHLHTMQTNTFSTNLCVQYVRLGDGVGTSYFLLMSLEPCLSTWPRFTSYLYDRTLPSPNLPIPHRRLGLSALSMGWCCANGSPLRARLGSAVVLLPTLIGMKWMVLLRACNKCI